MNPSVRSERPIFWIVAGPNGSGKSSVYANANIESFGGSVWIINPDLLAKRIHELESIAYRNANLEAVRRIEAWLKASIKAHQTVGVETVLSTPKYRKLVKMAKSLGFEVRLIYILLDSVERNIERVAIRVRKGGHSVPKKKIRERHVRSLAQFPWFLNEADKAWLYDNSGAKLRRIGDKQDGVIVLDVDTINTMPDVFWAVANMSTTLGQYGKK